MENNQAWAEDLYFKAKLQSRPPHELIYRNCPYPRLAYAIDGIIHNIGFKRDMELQASLHGVKPK